MKFFLLLPLFLLLCHCKEKNVNKKSLFLKDFEEVEYIGFNDKSIFDTCYVVPLETTPHNLIREISDLQIFNDMLFIFDTFQNVIFVFDRKGKFLYRINKTGKGPEEYIGISAFFIDKTDSTLYILDPLGNNINKYTLEGHFIEKINNSYNKNYNYLKTIQQIDENKFFCYFSTGFHENIYGG